MAKRKTTPQATNDLPDPGFPPIGEEPRQDSGPSVDDRIKLLTDSVSALTEQVKAGATREDRLSSMFLQLATAGRAPQANSDAAPVQVQPAQLDFSKLPDPTKDLAGFQRGIQEQLSAATTKVVQQSVAAVVQPQQAAADRAARVQGLWTKFKSDDRFKDVSEFEDVARGIANRKATEMQARGIQDPLAAALADEDSFLDGIAKDMRATIAKIKGADEEEGDSEDDTIDAPRDRQGQLQPRTLGIPGSVPQNHGAKRPDPYAGSTMISELKEAQAKMNGGRGVF